MVQHAFTRRYHNIVNVLKDSVIIENTESKQNIALNNAIWDTGASGSSININIADQIGLKPISYTYIQTANGICNVPIFIINVIFNDTLQINDLRVTGANLVDTDMLLGMDIIMQGQFTISNVNHTTISFITPSDSEVDYVELVNQKNKKLLKNLGRNAMCPCGSGKKVKDCCGPKYGL